MTTACSSVTVCPSFVYDARRTACPGVVAVKSVVSDAAPSKLPPPSPRRLHPKVPPSGVTDAVTAHVSPTTRTAGAPVSMSTSCATSTTGVVASHVTPAVVHVTFIVALPAAVGTNWVAASVASVKFPSPSPLRDHVRSAWPAGRTSADTPTVSPTDITAGTATSFALRIVRATRSTASTPAVPYAASSVASPPSVAVKVVEA
jgi:hypothetical protein